MVAIIAVLALVGFPALRKVLETANNGKCKANLKTLASACLAYAADNNGYLPANGPMDNNRPQSHVTHWALYNKQMEPYGLKYPNKVTVCPDETDKSLCLNTNIWCSYAIPGPLSPGSRWSGPFSKRYTPGPWPRIQQFNYPSKVILLYEFWARHNGEQRKNVTTTGATLPPPTHNVAFLDGSVGTFKTSRNLVNLEVDWPNASLLGPNAAAVPDRVHVLPP